MNNFTEQPPLNNLNLAKAHGCLMTFAWLFCAPTGILIARYYKYLFPSTFICKAQFWFVIHRPLMILVSVLTLLALVLILVFHNLGSEEMPHGRRVRRHAHDEDNQHSFVNSAHSIFGVLTISISIIQVIMGFLRCDKGHKDRHIFNRMHKTLGFLSLIFSSIQKQSLTFSNI